MALGQGTNYTQITTQQPWIQGSSLMASFFQFGNSDDNIRDLGLRWNLNYTYDNTVMSYLAGSPVSTSDPNGKFIIPQRLREEITSTCTAAPTASGANLILTLAAGEQRFRNGDVIMDGLSKVSARQISGEGTNVITVEPIGGITLSVSTMFQVGSYVTSMYNMSGVNASTGVKPLYEGFNEYSDYALFMRETVQYNRGDKLYVIQTAPNGAKFVWSQATVDAMNRFNKSRAIASFFGTSTYQSSSFQGTITGYRGMRNAAIAEGNAIQSPSALDKATFVNDMLMYVADNQPDQNQDLVFMSARQGLSTIQNLFPVGNVQTPIVTEIGGMDIAALNVNNNVQAVVLNGIRAKWCYSAVLQDSKKFPQVTTVTGLSGTQMQNSIYAFTAPSIPSIAEGGGASKSITRFVPTFATGEPEVSVQPGAFSKIAKASDGSYLCMSDTTGWTEHYGRTEGFHFQGQLFAMYEPTV